MLSFKSLIILLACLQWSYCDDSKYCSLCDNHTMCKYTDVGPECKESGESGVSESEKKEIVDVHNRLRRLVASGKETRGASGGQPKAADLRKIVWDEELAKVAQRWANQCHYGHDTCRDDPRWYVGQNIFWKSERPNHSVNWTEAVMSWYSEVDKVAPKDVEKVGSIAAIGHYTQVLWHETYAIGCGRKNYGDSKICVCNYGPGGNLIDEKVYTVGEPCSSCPEGTTCEDSLCAATTQNFRFEAPPYQEVNVHWRSNTIMEQRKSSQEKSWESNLQNEGAPPLSAQGIQFSQRIPAKGNGDFTIQNSFDISNEGNPVRIAWENDKDFVADEELENEINKLHAQIDYLLKAFLKKGRIIRTEAMKAQGSLKGCSRENTYR